MSNEDYRQGYKDGFKDGLEEGKKSVPLEPVKSNPPPDPYEKLRGVHIPPIKPNLWPQNANDDHCPKCGIKLTNSMGYVCHSPNCPTFLNVTCDTNKPMTGLTTGQFSMVDPNGSVEMKYSYQKDEAGHYGAIGSSYDGGLDQGLGKTLGVGRYGP